MLKPFFKEAIMNLWGYNISTGDMYVFVELIDDFQDWLDSTGPDQESKRLYVSFSMTRYTTTVSINDHVLFSNKNSSSDSVNEISLDYLKKAYYKSFSKKLP